MKYLKSFLESNQLDEVELIDFCEMSLAYLIDDGAKVRFDQTGSELTFNRIEIDIRMYWKDIKDQVIPFLSELKRKWQLQPIINLFGRFDIRIDMIYDDNQEDSDRVCIDIENVIDEDSEQYKRHFSDQAFITRIIFFVKAPKEINESSLSYGNDLVTLRTMEDEIDGIFVDMLDDGYHIDYKLTDYGGNIGYVRLTNIAATKSVDEYLDSIHHFYDYIRSKGYDFHHISLYGWILNKDRSDQVTYFGRKNWDFIKERLIENCNGRIMRSIQINIDPKR